MPSFENHGLTWSVDSPSHWRLDPRYSGRHSLEIAYHGDGWWLYLALENGEVSTKRFDTRDEAIGMVKLACENVGAC